jgi:transposase
MHPIRHRSEDAQMDLGIIKARDILVKTRTTLTAHVRAAVKSVGKRISKCNTECFHVRATEEMPPELAQVLEPVIKSIEDLTMRIRHYDNLIEKISTDKYPETQVLRAIRGVGSITALAFVLTIEDASRFKKSRNVGPFLGLTRKRDQSGETDKQLPITKAGNAHLRRVLVEAAWAYRHRPSVQGGIRKRQEGLSDEVKAISWKAQLRLCERYRRMVGRGKPKPQVVTAVARELLGFVWAVGIQVERETKHFPAQAAA